MTSPNDGGIYLLIFTAYISGFSADTVYVASHDYVTSPSDTPANQVFEGGLVNAGTLKLSMFENGGTVGKPAATQGYFELSNADGALDAWLDYGIGGWPFSLYYLETATSAYDTKTLVYKGTLRGWSSDDLRTTIKMRIRDKLESLDRPFLTTRYAGTTNSTGATAEGDTNMANQIKPYSIGETFQCPAAPANSYDLIYQASITSQSSIFASDGGLSLVFAVPTNYSSLAALRSATTGIAGSGAAIEAGEFATCLSDSVTGASYVRFGAQPAKAVTLQNRSSATEANISVGAVAYQMLLDAGVLSGDIDAASFTTLTSSSTLWRVGLFINDETTVIDAVCKVLNSVNATLIGTPEGKIKAVSLGTVPDALFPNPIFDDETVVDTFTNDDLSADSQFVLQASPSAEGDGVPAYLTYYKFARNWQTLSPGDLNAGVSPANIRLAAAEYRFTLSDGNLSLRDFQPLAQILTFEGQLSTGTGGQMMAQRLFDFYGKRRDYLTFTVPMSRGLDRLLGDIVLVLPTDGSGNARYGYTSDGKRMCLVGVTYDFGRRLMTFTAWG